MIYKYVDIEGANFILNDSFFKKVIYRKTIKPKNLSELRDKAIEYWILTKSKA